MIDRTLKTLDPRKKTNPLVILAIAKPKRTMAETAAYFEQHSVEKLFDELVKGLAAAKPADPKAWIAAQFQSAAALTPEAVTPPPQPDHEQ